MTQYGRLLLATAFLLNSVIVANALPPQGGRPGAGQEVFIPHAGYTRSATRAHLIRRAAERGQGLFAPGQPLSITGTRSVPVICVEFQNIAGPFPASAYQTLLFDPTAPRTMTSFYRDNSLGLLNVTGRVVGWYKAPKKDSFYENGGNGSGTPFGEFLKFGLTSADQDLDFSEFDNDGLDGIPNSGDDDGVVDTVFFIHPETGGECGQSSNIWSHSWQYSAGANGHGAPFQTNDVRRDANGHPVLLASGQPAHILIEDYTIQPAEACGSTAQSRQIVDIGVFCHEYGHALGLPDLYDRTPASPMRPDSEGIGHWCLMAGGSYGGNGTRADCPTNMSAWCKYYLGWATPRVVNADEDLDLDAVHIRNDVLRLNVPNTNDLEYFLIEYRKSGPDGGANWDEFLPISGLAVWHIDERVGDGSPNWPFTAHNQGQNDSPVRLNAPPAKLFKDRRPMVALLQADKAMHLENPVPNQPNRGDATDLFSAGDVGDDPFGKAGTRSYDGNATQLSIQNISVSSNSVTGKIICPPAPTGGGAPMAAAPPAAAPAQESVSTEVKEDLQSATDKLEGWIADFDTTKGFETVKIKAMLQPDEIRAVQCSNNHILHGLLKPTDASAMWHLSSRLRTEKLGEGADAKTPAATAWIKLVSAGPTNSTAHVGYAADGKLLAHVSGVNIPNFKDQLDYEPASHHFSDEFTDAMSLKGLQFEPAAAPSTEGLQKFSQTVKAGAEQLPIFDADLTLHYDGDQLVAINSTAVRAPTDVTGQDADATAEDAKKAVQSALGVSGESLGKISKGVYVPKTSGGAAAAEGRVAYRALIDAGEHREPLEAFIDAQTLKVLDVR